MLIYRHLCYTFLAQHNGYPDVCSMVRVLIPLLTIYDMCKMFDEAMAITDIHLLKRTDGKSGTNLSPK